MLQYIIYIIFHIIICLYFINTYYEYIINYLLIPINKQNYLNNFNFNIYKSIENALFYTENKDNINIYPIFEINFDINNITLIIYYLLIVYILIYMLPILILQFLLFIKSSLFKHEKSKLYYIIFYYIIIFLLSLYINNNICIHFILNILFNAYQQINLYLFDLNFNLYEYLHIYILILLLNFFWLVFIIYLMYYKLNKHLYFVFLFLFIFLLIPINIYIYLIEFFFFLFSYIIIKYLYIMIYYIKRIPSEYK